MSHILSAILPITVLWLSNYYCTCFFLETIEIKSMFCVGKGTTGENSELEPNKVLMTISTAELYQCGANYLCWDTQLISTTVNPCYCTCTTFPIKLLCLFRSTLIHVARLDLGRRTTEHCAGLQRHALEFLVEIKGNALMPQMPKFIFECNKFFTTHCGSADALSFLFQSAWIISLLAKGLGFCS